MHLQHQEDSQSAEDRVPERSATRFLIAGLSGLLGVTVLMWWYLTSYFGINYVASLSFPGNDGWCPNKLVGLGNHCWGDYSAIRFEGLRSVPSPPEAVYPLTTRIFRIPFWLVDQLGGFRLGLLVFVVCMTLLLLAPIWHASSGRSASERSVIILLTAVATSPFLITLDRGNLIFILAPACYIYLIGLNKEQSGYIASAAIIAALIKPQFAVLLLALLAMKRFRAFLLSIAALVMIYSTLYVAFAGQGVRAAVQLTLDSSRQWSSATDLKAVWPQNQSFEHAIIDVLRSLGFEQFASSRSVEVAVIMVLVTIVALLLVRINESALPVLGIALLAISSYAMPTTYAYYSVTALSIVAYIVKQDGQVGALIGAKRASDVILLIALICSLTPLVWPVEFIPIEVGGPSLIATNLLSVVVPLAWLLFLISVMIHGLNLRTPKFNLPARAKWKP